MFRGKLSYLSLPSLPGQLLLSPMTLEQFFRGCERVTVPMWLIPSPCQKNSLGISGARLYHQMLRKLAIQVLSVITDLLASDRHLDLEPHRPLKPTTRVETQHWASERSCSQDSPRFQTLAHRRQSDSSSAVSSTSASFLSSAPDGVSPSDPSPVSPLTPHTSTPFPPGPQDSLPSSLKVLSGNSRTSMPPHTHRDTTRPVFFDDREKPQKYGRRSSDDHPSPQQLHRTEASPSHKPAELRDIYGVNYSNSHPVRPW